MLLFQRDDDDDVIDITESRKTGPKPHTPHRATDAGERSSDHNVSLTSPRAAARGLYPSSGDTNAPTLT